MRLIVRVIVFRYIGPRELLILLENEGKVCRGESRVSWPFIVYNLAWMSGWQYNRLWPYLGPLIWSLSGCFWIIFPLFRNKVYSIHESFLMVFWVRLLGRHWGHFSGRKYPIKLPPNLNSFGIWCFPPPCNTLSLCCRTLALAWTCTWAARLRTT